MLAHPQITRKERTRGVHIRNAARPSRTSRLICSRTRRSGRRSVLSRHASTTRKVFRANTTKIGTHSRTTREQWSVDFVQDQARQARRASTVPTFSSDISARCTALSKHLPTAGSVLLRVRPRTRNSRAIAQMLQESVRLAAALSTTRRISTSISTSV